MKAEKRWVTSVSSFFAFLLISAFAAPFVTLNGDFSGRSSADFVHGQNIKFVLARGTKGRVESTRLFKSGNYGFYISILNGKYEGRHAWIHYNPKLGLVSLCEGPDSSAGACVPTRSPSRASSVRTESSVTAQSGPSVNAAVAATSSPVVRKARPVARTAVHGTVPQETVKEAHEILDAINGLSAKQGNPCTGAMDEVRVNENSCVRPLENKIRPYFGNNTNAPVSSQQRQAFLGYIVPIAVAVQRQTGYPASVIIAQSILETSWGRSSRFNKGNALLGHSCWNPGQISPFTVSLAGKEHTVYGSCNSRRPEGGFYYSFDNPIDSVYAYVAGMTKYGNPMWVKIRSSLDQSYRSEQGYRLASAGMAIVDQKKIVPLLSSYARDPSYVPKLKGLIQKYHLDLYDRRTLCV